MFYDEDMKVLDEVQSAEEGRKTVLDLFSYNQSVSVCRYEMMFLCQSICVEILYNYHVLSIISLLLLCCDLVSCALIG